MAAICNRSKDIAMMGKKLVVANSSRGIHSSLYDKNPDGYIQPTLVPDKVVNSDKSGKYWVPHPETGVLVPVTAINLESSTKTVHNEVQTTVMEQKAWFRPSSLEDSEKPNC